LHCDDIVVGDDATPNADCGRAAEGFRTSLGACPPRIGVQRVTEAEVAARCGEILGTRSPAAVIANSVDLETARILERLRRDGRIRLFSDEAGTRAALKITASRDGCYSATIGDVRRVADLVWLIGNPERFAPRLLEKAIDPRRPARLVRWSDGASATDLAALAARWLAAASREEAGRGAASNATGKPGALVDALRSSRYAAIIVGDDAFAGEEASAAGFLLNQIVWRLNESRRAALVMLDPTWTVRSVTAWSSNENVAEQPGRWAGDGPLVRLGGPPDLEHVRATVQVGGVDRGAESAEIFLPASTVGVHHRGAVIRGDGAVTLPLSRIRQADRPTAAQWLLNMLSELEPQADVIRST
jgi:hypothetical protein